MKYLIVVTLSVAALFGSSVRCNQDRPAFAENANIHPEMSKNTGDTKNSKMKIKIGSDTFNATLFDNPTATAFKRMLPLTLKMDELNGNEKKYDFPNSLPTDSSNPHNINAGDLMLWGNNTLVLFYKSFPTAYSYTKIGRIDDPSKLEDAMGAGNVTVSFEFE